jgi:dTDP-4-dehydrorhamnose 3,5-epimerase
MLVKTCIKNTIANIGLKNEMMKIIKCEIEDLLVLEPQVYEDTRGYFFECYHKEKFRELGIKYEFVQDNQSLSQKNVLRGLHFQKPPYEQGKLVRVFSGRVLDVAVDIRKNSPTYGKWHSTILDPLIKNMYWIPPGFAHGFLTLEDNTVFFYKCTQVYNKESEGAILWNDPVLNIKWGISHPILSEKDKISPLFKDFDSPF